MGSDMYRELSELPVPVGAQFLHPANSNSTGIEIATSIRDHVRNSKRTMTKSIYASQGTIRSSLPQDVSDVVLSSLSPSLKYRAILRSKEGKRFIELWVDDRLLHLKDVTSLHGDFSGDEYLSSLSFSPKEDSVIYTAEAKPSDTETFRYIPSFGEGLTARKTPVLFVYHPGNDTLSRIAFDGPVIYGQALFGPFTESETLFATGYERTSDDRLLGIKGCFNRPSGIWKIELSSPISSNINKDSKDSLLTIKPKKATKLTSNTLSCRSLRIYNQHILVWIANASGGPHASCSTLHSMDLTSIEAGQPRTLVESVWEPKEEDFPGLYLGPALARDPFILHHGDPSVLVTSIWGSRSSILRISLTTGRVEKALDITDDCDGEFWSYTLLAADGKQQMVFFRSSPRIPCELILYDYDVSGIGESWTDLASFGPSSADTLRALQSLDVQIIKIPDHFPAETIVVRPKDQANLPCVINPHGGPHATTTTVFVPSTSALAIEGYAISQPNYTGSLGFGEKYVRALMGQCGTLDVSDCIASVRHILSLGLAQEGPGKLFVMGGSHGGFLAAHLIGQYPETFTSAVMRNPVISAGDVWGSDIPDWYFSEFGYDFHMSQSPPYTVGSREYEALQHASPVSYVQDVRAAVLLMLGGSDHRVNPKQGLGYYHALKGREGNRKVDLLWFDGEGHPLEGVEASRVGWERTRDWFQSA
ncbi:alpha/beta-hydrolase [Guyanagaster necrorhizus]|uniref:acylaminoacyl-peptidase n=1 Tax=Guyanagaster necrorhizus TaxID=856835 RepID=A0A9P7VNP5_9AGAR|nr:alpha/beta-hydrolase [Guyanagaster necrorhizus MCA 3950]KAG7443189.1 alpha/beta-hydrolase [Guyanagaster necrorhizus MCA 3950]